MTNSAGSPPSKSLAIQSKLEPLAVTAALSLLVWIAASWFFARGYILYYGDAQAHLNSSRSIIDSRTPGYDQIGTVWLPVLHLLCVPFVRNDWMWQSGLAGTVPVAICFVIAGLFLYLAAREAYGNAVSAAVVVACFALNPNLLYLASIPMTEVVFLAGLTVTLFCLLRFRRTQSVWVIALAVGASWWMSLTRYDGWFLFPFTGLALSLVAKHHRVLILISFGALAVLAPLYWMGHCYWETGDALDFFRGPYSAAAIQGGKPYPGYHDWKTAIQFYSAAGQLCTGWPIVLCGIVGAGCALIKRTAAPLLFLMLTPLFYIWSIHSSGNPIHVPQLWFGAYYNTRYGIAVLPLAAFATGATVLVIPHPWRHLSLLLPLITLGGWLLHPSPQNWICWKESQVNSEARRVWTKAGADFLSANYRNGDGVLVWPGDLTGIFAAAQVPLVETINVGNGPEWYAATARPDLFHDEKWVIAQAGDRTSIAMEKGDPKRTIYRVVEQIQVKDAPLLTIYRRTNRLLPEELPR